MFCASNNPLKIIDIAINFEDTSLQNCQIFEVKIKNCRKQKSHREISFKLSHYKIYLHVEERVDLHFGKRFSKEINR